ncbi:MAG: alcohol dehydrogenase catalytic domain-containing protein [Planctomycetes bacterium]|nr:alcohol dehydrogenase catalytic domain-containing protein [Planctomycetota bacterium]
MPTSSKTRKRRGPRSPAAFQTGLRRIEVADAPVPSPKAGEVLVELTAIGICGSDLHYFRIGRIGSQVVTFPFILGHEPAGVVAGVGKGVQGFKEGQRVAIEPGIACGACPACREGRENLCYKIRFLGSPGFAGAFQRYLAMPAACVEHLPAGVDAALGSATEPLGVALHALKLVRLRAGERIGVIGGGPIGLSVAALARAQGAKVAVLSDPRALRRGIAKKLGAARTVEPAGFVETARKTTEGLGADVVFECSGSSEAYDQAVAACRRGGRIGVLGITEVDYLSLNPHDWRRGELEIVQCRRSNHTLPEVLAQLAQDDLGLHRAGFFSNTIGLGGIQEAFERLEDRASSEVKVIVDPRRV